MLNLHSPEEKTHTLHSLNTFISSLFFSFIREGEFQRDRRRKVVERWKGFRAGRRLKGMAEYCGKSKVWLHYLLTRLSWADPFQ